ncbi:hypothetical protein DFH08DRAFT_717359, partial [Mycena albidolilacea]
SWTGEEFQTYIDAILDNMNPYPQDNSVIVMENASTHHFEGRAFLSSALVFHPNCASATVIFMLAQFRAKKSPGEISSMENARRMGSAMVAWVDADSGSGGAGTCTCNGW